MVFAKHIINRFSFVNEAAGGKLLLGETKLQKLLFICDGYLLAAGSNLIKECAKAWNYGPVYPRIHTWLKKETDAFTKKYEGIPEELSEKEEITELVDAVLNTYGRWSANDLSNWSHRPGSPWETALEKGRGVMNSPIDKNDMKAYFQGLVRGNQQNNS